MPASQVPLGQQLAVVQEAGPGVGTGQAWVCVIPHMSTSSGILVAPPPISGPRPPPCTFRVQTCHSVTICCLRHLQVSHPGDGTVTRTTQQCGGQAGKSAPRLETQLAPSTCSSFLLLPILSQCFESLLRSGVKVKK